MKMNCCMCKESYNPLLQRSFHSFPKNEERRKKWIDIIGHTVSKTARVCSDHFTESDYNTYNTMSKSRRLKNTANPFHMQYKSETIDKIMEIEQLNENDSNNNNNSDVEPLFVNSKTDYKRKLLSYKTDRCTKKKVIVKTSSLSTMCFTEADFCKKEKWTRFLKYVYYNRQEHANWMKKYRRSQNRQLTMKIMLQGLKKKNLLSANAIDDLKVNVHNANTYIDFY